MWHLFDCLSDPSAIFAQPFCKLHEACFKMYTQASGFFMWQFSLKVQAIKVYRLARPMFHQACCPWYFPSHCCAKLWHISHCQTLTLAKVSHEQKLASKFKVTEIEFNVFLNSQVGKKRLIVRHFH